MTKRWLMSLILGCLLLSLPAAAQTFEDGYQSYVRNQFPVAELQFKNALRKATAEEDKAVLLKFIGICQFMRNDKKNAQASFIQALNADRSIAIESEDVLDPSVLGFFAAIKSKMGPEPKKAPKAAAAPQRQAPKPTAKTKPKQQKPQKTTKSSRPTESIMALNEAGISEDRSHKISFTQFLPFGLPQVHNDSYLLAGAFAAGQAFAIYTFLDANNTIKGREGLNQIVANKEGLTDDQRQAFYKQNNGFIKKVEAQKTLALGAFALVWAASIGESLLFHNHSNRVSENDGVGHRHSVTPLVEVGRSGGAVGVQWQAKLQ